MLATTRNIAVEIDQHDDPYTCDCNDTDPARDYHEAKVALAAMLDSSDRPWEDALVLIRQMAERRHAYILTAALNAGRAALDTAARQQDMTDRMTDAPAPEDRALDAAL